MPDPTGPLVFVAANSLDYGDAQRLYNFLIANQVRAFFAKQTLADLGRSDYRKEIDDALDRAEHMVVVTSSAANVRSDWLEAEWGFFVNEKRSGRKAGNLVTVVVGAMGHAELSPSLRYYEVIPFTDLDRVLRYVGRASGQASSPVTGPAAPIRTQALTGSALRDFVLVPEGPFLMGSDKTKDPQADDDEVWQGTPHGQGTLDLPDFWIARVPVTVAQFKVFVEASGFQADNRALSGKPDHPVVHVSWKEALEYCRWLDDALRASDTTPADLRRRFAEGWHTGLPSEAEWEKAARGTDGRIYPWDDTIDTTRANYAATGLGTTSAVGAFPAGASPYGLLDMSGNVWEWTRSLKKPYPYDPADGRENPSAKGARVVRGGAFNNGGRRVRAAFRADSGPGSRLNGIGFRVVVSRSRAGSSDLCLL